MRTDDAISPGSDPSAGVGQPDVTADLAVEEEPATLRQVLEAVLLVVDAPVPEVELAQVVERPTSEVVAELEALAAELAEQRRGFELRRVGAGWRFYTAAACAPYVERYVLDGQTARLTQAALETLAVIAYRQPVTRQSVAAIRGVSCDGVIRTLQTRGLVAEVGEDPSTGAHLYGTTPTFLERLGLTSLEQLPDLAPLLPATVDDIDDLA
jgi:segregation and condensation protein B